MQVDMTLFPSLEGLDVAFLERPIGRARYVATDSNLVWDLATRIPSAGSSLTA